MHCVNIGKIGDICTENHAFHKYVEKWWCFTQKIMWKNGGALHRKLCIF